MVQRRNLPPRAGGLLAACALALWVSAPAQGQTVSEATAPEQGTPTYSARARVQAPITATNAEDPTASGTRIDLRARHVALETVGEAMIEVPGVRVQHTGGYGSFSGVALRGAETGHTAILLGTIPLHTADSGAFDLSLLPLQALDSIEVYRGGAPAWLSDGAIGGVVRFIPGDGERRLLRASVGYGSFGRMELRGTTSVTGDRGRRPSLFTHINFVRADNDYRYIDDNQTVWDTSDDRVMRQTNADIHAGSGLMHAGIDVLGGRLELVAAGHGRTEGIPGPLASPAFQVRRQWLNSLGALSWQREKLDVHGEMQQRIQVLASVGHQTARYTDLEAESGISREMATDDLWLRSFVRAAGGLRVLPFMDVTLVGSAAWESYRPDDPLAPVLLPFGRATQALGVESRIFGRIAGMRAELRPSVRTQWSQAQVHQGLESTADGQPDERVFAPTYRMGAVIEPTGFWALAASIASGVRLPAMAELFGDRAFQEANPLLRPERSTSIDVSSVLRGRTGPLRGAVEVRGFALQVRDLIRFERTAQFRMVPQNIDSGRILGLELGARGAFGRHLSLASSLTAMDARNQHDQQLPLRPPLQFLVRPELALFPNFAERLSLFVEAHHVSFMYLDQPNLSTLEARTLLSVGGSLHSMGDRVQVHLRMRNVMDTFYQDIVSRPLPGREIMLSLSLQERVDRR